MNLQELYLPKNPKWRDSAIGDTLMFLGVAMCFLILYPSEFEKSEWAQNLWPIIAVSIYGIYLAAPIFLLRPISKRRVLQGYSRTGMIFFIVYIVAFCMTWWLSTK
jgi:hypothetical protein